MNKDKIKTVKIEKILLAEDNYRFEPQKNQKDAFQEMIKKEGNKVYNLGISLSEGLLSHEFMVVKPAHDGFYVAAEGNRRLTALMCLRNPEILRGISEDLFEKFKNLSKGTIPEEIDVYVEADNAEIIRILELKHNGENEGKGAVPWDSTMKARFRQSIGKKDIINAFLDDMVDKSVLTKKQAYVDVTRTNWERFLNSKLGKDYLGIKVENGKLISDPLLVNKTQKERIKKVADGLKNQSVDIVYNKEKIKTFIETLDKDFELKNNDNNTNEKKKISSDINKPSVNPVKPQIYIIPSNIKWNCEQTKISEIINELKSLNANQFPNAATILFRSLIDMSARWYVYNHKGTSMVSSKTGIDLVASILGVIDNMIQKGEMDKGEKKQLQRLLNKQNIITILNSYTHDYNVNCMPSEVFDMFKGMQHYLEICVTTQKEP